MWFRSTSLQPSLQYPLPLILLLILHSGLVIAIPDENSTELNTTSRNSSISTDIQFNSNSSDELTSLFTQIPHTSKEHEKERETGNATYGHVTPHSFSTSGVIRDVTSEGETGNGTGEYTSGKSGVTRTTEIASPYGRRENELKRKLQSHPKINNGSSWLNNTQHSREPVRKHPRRGEPVDQRIDRSSIDSYFGENYEDNLSYDDSQSYRDLRIGSDDYGTFEELNDRMRYSLSREDLFREYEDLQYEKQPQPVNLNSTDISLAKGTDSWSRDNRSEYEDLYDSHLIQDIPEESSVIKRIVSLRGKLSSDRINISLIVIYGWLALVLLTIATALLVLRYKHKFSTECSRISHVLRLGVGCKGTSALEEGNNLLAHPLV